MIEILVNGIAGHMGRQIVACALESDDIQVAAGVDRIIPSGCTVPCYSSIGEVSEHYDLIIDFSVAEASDALLDALEKHPVPVIIGTTGLSDAQLKRIRALSKQTPVFRTGNMSLGVNLMMKLVEDASRALGDAFDPEITETHHRLKKDAPSGTALMLCDAVKAGRNDAPELVYGRSPSTGKRTDHEIGIHSRRGGTVVGEHTVSFFGNDEVIEITHKAFSKRVFAEGALRAARFLIGCEPGMYDMTDVL